MSRGGEEPAKQNKTKQNYISGQRDKNQETTVQPKVVKEMVGGGQ